MSLAIKIAGTTFTKFVDKVMPYADLASGIWLFGGDEVSSLRNLAKNPSVSAGTLIGVAPPVYGKGYVDFRLPAATLGSSMDSGITPNPTAPLAQGSRLGPR